MSKKILIVTISSIAAIMLGLGAYWLISNRSNDSHDPQSLDGKITVLSEGCSTGNTCSITLDNAKVLITSCGVMPKDPQCKDYDQSRLQVGAQIKSVAVKSEFADYYNLDCDICTIKVE